MKISLINRIDEISREDWNRITGLDYPFTMNFFMRLKKVLVSVKKQDGHHNIAWFMTRMN